MTTLAFSFLCSLPREPLCEIEQKNILLALIYQLSRAILLCKMIEETLHDHFVRNDRQYKRRRTVDQTQGTQDFNVENISKEEGKNYGHQPANLHYIG